MTTVEVLRRVRERIAKPKHWTTGAYARTSDGRSIEAWNPAATCWCLAGAFQAERLDSDDYIVVQDLCLRDHEWPILVWQDEQDHSTVVGWLDKIIKELEGET